MNSGAWIAVGAALICMIIGAGVFVVLRRRNRASDDPDAVLRAARRAIQESARDRRQRSKGSMRGKGQGGDPNLAIDSGIASDSGGTP